MKAPEYLCGSLHKSFHALHRERAQWVKARIEEGAPIHTIASALGISESAVFRVMQKYRIPRYLRRPTAYLRRNGITVGWVRPSIDAMSPAARACLADEAARARKPMAEVLADFWAKHHEVSA